MLYYSIYKSRALFPPDGAAHEDILCTCRDRNASNDITGFLHRENDLFVQYLEGPEQEVKATLSRIMQDNRHDQLEVIGSGQLKTRHLPEWQMGFVTGDLLSLNEVMDLNANGEPDFKGMDPFDLVVFMVSNSQSLSASARAA